MLSERFWSHVDKTDTCWIWTGALTKGYGQATVNKKYGYSHRLIWEYMYGEIPKGMVICHKCDEPKCVNPHHLFIGTQKENITDMIQKGRRMSGVSKGENNGFSKLTNIDVAKIRECAKQGRTYRDIANEYKISKSQIGNIVNNVAWKE